MKVVAKRRGFSLNKLFEEFTARALTEADLEARFWARAARGAAARGLESLDRVGDTAGERTGR